MIRIATINTQGFSSKPLHIANYIQENKLDIVFLQELYKPNVESLRLFNHNCPGTLFLNHGSRICCGTGIFLNNNISQYYKEDKNLDKKGRTCQVKIKIDNTDITLTSIYGLANGTIEERAQFFELLKNNLNPNDFNIVGGDWNCVTDITDHTSTDLSHSVTRGSKSLIDCINTLDLKDTLKSINDSTRKYTRIHRTGFKSRIDRIYVSNKQKKNIRDFKIIGCPFSDHECYYSDILLTQNTKWGKGLWKHNNSHLQDTEYVNIINHLIDEHDELKLTYNTPADWWDDFKTKVKHTSIRYGKRKSEKTNKLRNQLQIDLNSEIEKVNPNVTKITEIKNQMNDIKNNQTRGLIVRSRERFFEWGGNFHSKEKQNFGN